MRSNSPTPWKERVTVERAMKLIRPLIITVGLILAWQAVVSLTEVPFFILPSPMLVAIAMIEHADKLLENGLITLGEILGGLLLGIILGTASALVMGSCPKTWS